MASAQVMSNSAVSTRKQQQLEAGKRRLEEFRKKKAAAKKAASTSQSHNADSKAYEKQALENGQAESVNSVGAAAEERADEVTETSGFLDHNDKLRGSTHGTVAESVPLARTTSETRNFMSPDSLQMHPEQEGNSHNIQGLKYQTGFIYPQQREESVSNVRTGTGEESYAFGSLSGRQNASRDDNSSNFHSNSYEVEVAVSNKNISSPENLMATNFGTNDVAAKVHPEGDVTNLFHNGSDAVHPRKVASEFGHIQLEAPESKNPFTSGLEEIKTSNAVGSLFRFGSHQASEPLSASLKSDVSGSVNGPLYSTVAETFPRRSRPSFLDSLNIGRDSPGSGHPYSSSTIQDPSTASAPVETLSTSASQNSSASFFGDSFRGEKLLENSMGSKLEYNSQKQNEDFAALEQHIEDLTQEKFSMQRALEASKALAESLATENSSLTESYNQQAGHVNQLKAEMERLQGEIKSLLVELEAIKAEYMNAQLECNAADERAKLLASEVIGLEEKALRLRSNELKLERELENSNAEISSYKKKLSSIDKERRDLMQTIDALQEEKKLLQSKLRKASASGISAEVSKGQEKRDASTSTNDLGLDAAGVDGNSSLQASSNVQVPDDADNSLLLSENRHIGFEDVSMAIPPDQAQIIENINSLISEIMAEKEELIQALVTEVSTSTKLKDMNKELSQKLEVQTQRLELLTAQSMANENISVRQPAGSNPVRETVAYADEGDEVVERVLGWIMKLFPGGPAKRRSSRL